MESLSRLPNSLETWTLPGSRSCPKYEKIRSFDRFLCTTSPYGNHLVQGTISKEFRVYLSDEKYSIGNLQKLAFEHPFPFAPPLSLQPCHSVQDQRRSRKSPPFFLVTYIHIHLAWAQCSSVPSSMSYFTESWSPKSISIFSHLPSQFQFPSDAQILICEQGSSLDEILRDLFVHRRYRELRFRFGLCLYHASQKLWFVLF